jgi:molybdopterin converting factor small subunit
VDYKEAVVKKVIFGILILIILAGTLTACGAGEGNTAKLTTPAVTSTLGWDAQSVPAPTIISAPTFSDETKGGEIYSYNVASDRMVIMSGYLTLVVDDVSAALSQITALAAANGGFVVSSNIQEDQNRLYASISFRVDSTLFNSTINALHNMAIDIKSESTSGQDVTDQYVDLDARLRNLEASEAQLLDLMEQAGTVEEILKVQQELTNTRGQIEQIKGQMQYLEQSVALALISVTLEQSKLSVEFTANTRTIQEGESVQFVPAVAGGISPYTYEWDFGDGNTSTEPAPAHVYDKIDTFTVTLKVTDDRGNSDEYTRSDYITVTEQPGWSGGSVAGTAWKALLSFFRGLASFFIGLGIFSPIWIAILVILYFTWWRRRKNKAQ